MQRVVAVILVAGQGKRMGAEQNKIFLELAGRPAVLWSVDAIARTSIVDDILLVAHPDEVERVRTLTEMCAKVVRVVPGGATRSQSEMCALNALRTRIVAREIEIVMIHDGARPLVTPEEIARLTQAVRDLPEPGGALLTASVAPSEEIGEIGPDGTLTRDFAGANLARAQTPQAFHATLLLDAYDRGAAEGFDGGDTASTVERLGAPIVSVAGSNENLKLTTPDDLACAEAIIQARSRA
jgi:2-C-methyl-D-erythritol 4-phosphate cytidylyltransferase